MKNLFSIFFSLMITQICFCEELKPIPGRINELHKQGTKFVSTDFFEIDRSSPSLSYQLSSTVKNSTLVRLMNIEINSILSSRPEYISINIPLNSGASFELELFKAEIFSPGFTVVTAKNNG